MGTCVRVSVSQAGDDFLRVGVEEAESGDLDANSLATAVRRAVAAELRRQGLLLQPEERPDRFSVLVLSDGETWEEIGDHGPTVVELTGEELKRLHEGEDPSTVVEGEERFTPVAAT